MGKQGNEPNPNPGEPNPGEPTPQPNPNPGEPNPGTGGEDPLDKFVEIKERYEKQISDKDSKIKELEEQLENEKKEHKEALKNFIGESDEKLNTSEEYKEMLKKVEVLAKERAEATVDAYIKKGVILPTQRDTAVKLCLSDNDTFSDLYRDAKPIVQTEQKRMSVPTGTAERIVNYFKK